MSISVQCPNTDCQKKLKAPDQAAGKRVKCPGCGQSVSIPGIQSAPQRKETTAAKQVVLSVPEPSDPVPLPPKRKPTAAKRTDPEDDPVPVLKGRRVRWPWYAGGTAVSLCLVAGLVFFLFGTGNSDNPTNTKPGGEGATTKPTGTMVGTFGDWEVQLLRVEFVNDLGYSQANNSNYANFELNGSRPTRNLLVCLRRVCIRDTKVTAKNGLTGGIPTFTLTGKDKPLPLRALGQVPPQESQPTIKLIPAYGLIGFAGSGESSKGEEAYLVAVISLDNPDATPGPPDNQPMPGQPKLNLIVDLPLNVRVLVDEFVPGQKVELQLAIPDKK